MIRTTNGKTFEQDFEEVLAAWPPSAGDKSDPIVIGKIMVQLAANRSLKHMYLTAPPDDRGELLCTMTTESACDLIRTMNSNLLVNKVDDATRKHILFVLGAELRQCVADCMAAKSPVRPIKSELLDLRAGRA